MAVTAKRSFVAVTVTLAAANTNYNLYDLINAILQAETGVDTNIQAPGMAKTITIQAYPGIDGSGANTKDVLVGDAKLSTSRMAFVLQPGGFIPRESTLNNVDITGLYAQSSTTNQKLNIAIWGA